MDLILFFSLPDPIIDLNDRETSSDDEEVTYK